MIGKRILRKTTLYIFCQLSGWGGYGLAMALFYRYSANRNLTAQELISIGSLCLLAIGLTHGFRAILRKITGWNFRFQSWLFWLLLAIC
jgi:hypothetical protein